MRSSLRDNFTLASRRRALLLALILLIGAGASAVKVTQPRFKTLVDYQSQKLTWQQCYDNFECSTLRVPIDYSNLKLGIFKLALLRYKATDQKHRIGSLVVNPGGPGASGKDYAYNAESILNPDILSNYDIVGFDPRGVGDSAPIHCLNDAETDASYAADSKPDNPAELVALEKQGREYAAKCLAKTKFLDHYGTVNSARDMDILRLALGDKKLNFLGKSYGTYLGTLYASLFPSNVGRMVLDGAVDPSISAVQQSISQAVGFDKALDSFITDCFTRSDCPLEKQSSKDVSRHELAVKQIIGIFHQAAVSPLLDKIDNSDATKKKFLTGQHARMATESLVVLGTASALYDNESGWPQLRTAIQESVAGYGATFLALGDEYSQRNTQGRYANNETDAGFVIDCLDWPENRTVSQITKDAKVFTTKAPVFGPYLAYGSLACKNFASKSDTAKLISMSRTIDTNPVVIIGTTRDPATPYTWAEGLHSKIHNSRLISLSADGHTGQGRGSTCVDFVVDSYYLSGKLPIADLQCAL